MSNASALIKTEDDTHGMSPEAKITASVLLAFLISITILGSFLMIRRIGGRGRGEWEGGRCLEEEEFLGVLVHRQDLL